MLTAASFFDIDRFAHAELFAAGEPVWRALAGLKTYIDDQLTGPGSGHPVFGGIGLDHHVVIYQGLVIDSRDLVIEFGDVGRSVLRVRLDGEDLDGASVVMAGAVLMGCRIRFGRGVLVESGAMIKAPAIIGDHSEVRQGAYMRGNCLVGRRCVVGHSTEVKHSVLLDDAKAGHFNYLGDSILGNEVNLGAGTKLANLRFLPGNVLVRTPQGQVDSGLRKFGAILGDRCQTGCNSVTNPGTVIGRDAFLLPNVTAPSGLHQECAILR